MIRVTRGMADSFTSSKSSKGDGSVNKNLSRIINELGDASGTPLTDSFVKYRSNKPSIPRATSFVAMHTDETDTNTTVRWSNSRRRCCSKVGAPSILALAAGIVHGVAGPGGVLGVIPAVQLRDARLASIYLGVFCLTSTLVMGGFASFYSKFSEWMAGGRRREESSGSRIFLVEAGSAGLSIVVGIVWLILLSIGKLEEVFP